MLDQHAAKLTSPTSYAIRPDAKRFENWEQYFAGKAALGVAIDYALDWGLENIQNRIYELAADLRQKLSALEGITVTDEGVERCGLVTFYAQQIDASAIKTALAKDKINVSVSSGSGSFVSFEERGLESLVRASVHYFNTTAEVDLLIEKLEGIL